MKGFWKDFKAFISKGNIIDLAIAVIIGGAFGKIVTSLVNDIIMPLISLATGGVSISDWKWIITPADAANGIAESALNYGFFIQTILDFLIIAFFIFLAIRLMRKSKQKLEEVTTEIKSGIKKKKWWKKKSKDAELITPVDGVTIDETPDTSTVIAPVADISTDISESKTDVPAAAMMSESGKNEIVTAIAAIAERTNQSNKTQEQLLSEIRDILKNK